MTTKQMQGMLKFHKSAYKAYKASGQKVMAHNARKHMIALYLQLRTMRGQ